ncbi:MAG: hypothetical protein M9936_00350 [Caldilinea sp.]|nr:hypothetical protein [Caldilineaceae bacterium]MCB9123789.1 hypothetical protein [Caldilineaceae bacterium]MCO5208113.1 hypothetical protein [Caldilinea sp.]MCW5842826.1 hypothetical protein [Caldilinea sp.]
MLIVNKVKALAEVVGFATIALLALYGLVALFNNADSAIAADMTFSGAAVLLQAGDQASPGIPPYINYQGTLRDRDGNPLSGVYTMTLRIYDSLGLDAQPKLTSPDNSVTVRNGNFSILLGDNPADTPSLSKIRFTGPDQFIGVTIAGHNEMPRQRFAAVPYAFRSGHAYALGGQGDAPYTAVWVDQGKVRIGNQESTHPVFTPSDDAQVTIENQANNRWGMLVTSTGGGSAYGLKIKTAYQGHADVPLFLASAGGGDDEYQRFVIEANGNVGVGVDLPEYKLDVGGRARILGAGGNNSAGIWFSDTIPSQIGFVGLNTADTMGFYGSGAGWGLLMNTANGNVTMPGSLNTGNLGVGGNLGVNGSVDVVGEIRGKMQYTGEYEVDSGDPVQMIHSSHGFCFLTYIRGEFEWDSRTARVFIGDDGYWYLDAGPNGVWANARCAGVSG